MITPYLSQQPVDDFSSRFASIKYSSSLSASTDTTLVIPGNANRYKALIKANGVVWVALNATAAIPVGNTFASTTSEFVDDANRICREVIAGDVLHFFAPVADTEVSVVLYSLLTNN